MLRSAENHVEPVDLPRPARMSTVIDRSVRGPLSGVSAWQATSIPRWATDALFALFALSIGAFWFHDLLRPHAPSGGDPGNWLALGNKYFGVRVRSSQVTYPPLVPTLVASAVRLGCPSV